MQNSNLIMLDKVLEKYVETLSVSDAQFDKVRDRCTSIWKWLVREGSTLRDKNPEVYPQGSFLVGTAIHHQNGALDVDLVCCMDFDKSSIAQKDLKEKLGKELTEYVKAKNMKNKPESKKRCWMVEYEDGTHFHIDILPAIPDKDGGYKKYLLESGVTDALSKTAICITDDTLANYPRIDNQWLRSNPKGYALWFKDRMKIPFERGAKSLLERQLYNAMEEIPMHKVKTPLQKAVQILKWHRDVMFEKNPDKRPISCVVSTLAAHSYQSESRLVDAVLRIAGDMDKYIGKDGEVKNPVRPDENFADKWKADPTLKDNFDKWLERFRRDLKEAASKGSEREMIEVLGMSLGKTVMGRVLENSGYQVKSQPAPTILRYPEVKASPTKQWSSDDKSRI